MDKREILQDTEFTRFLEGDGFGGHDLTTAEFWEYVARDIIHASPQFRQHVYIILLGSGFVPLQFAVIARHEGDAYEAMEEWCRDNNRADEIGEDEAEDEDAWGEYESSYHEVPLKLLIELTSHIHITDDGEPVVLGEVQATDLQYPYTLPSTSWAFTLTHKGKTERFIMARGEGYKTGPGVCDVVLASLKEQAGDRYMAWDLSEYPKDFDKAREESTLSRDEAEALAAIGQVYFDKLVRLELIRED
jgi:hypothetical protein